MTPQEIVDYKMRWLPGHSVRLHSDLDIAGKDWCRRTLEQHQWSFAKYTNVYEHTFCFEDIRVAQNFEMEFSNWANK